MSGGEPVPIVLVTGALGAGKTTLINRFLAGDHGRALAAVVNDFGALDIDARLLAGEGRSVYGLKNGCICCSLQGDLLRTIRLVLTSRPSLDGIVIEASGVSDPRGILEALLDPVLAAAIRVDSIVTVVDAEAHDAHDPLWRAQVRLADFIFVSKAEAAPPEGVQRLGERLAALGKPFVFGGGPGGAIAFEVLFAGLARRREPAGAGGQHERIGPDFVSCEWVGSAPVDMARFQAAIEAIAPDLVRAKGFVAIRGEAGGGFVFQLVGRRAGLHKAAAPVVGVALVLIGRAGEFDPAAACAVLDRELGGQRVTVQTMI